MSAAEHADRIDALLHRAIDLHLEGDLTGARECAQLAADLLRDHARLDAAYTRLTEHA